jgi:hypothetical protein
MCIARAAIQRSPVSRLFAILLLEKKPTVVLAFNLEAQNGWVEKTGMKALEARRRHKTSVVGK